MPGEAKKNLHTPLRNKPCLSGPVGIPVLTFKNYQKDPAPRIFLINLEYIYKQQTMGQYCSPWFELFLNFFVDP